MDFNLSDEQKQLKASITAFTKKEIEPIAGEMDREGRIPDPLIEKMAKLGLLGMTIPQVYGGAGASTLDCALSVEALAYSATGAWWLIAFSASIPACIVAYGTDEQKRSFLRAVCEGAMIPSIQFTEPDTGSDPKAITTTSKPVDDYYLVNGAKRFSTFASRKGFAIVYANDDTGRVSAFVIPKFLPGYSVGKVFELMGSGGIETCDVYFDDMKIKRSDMLGEKGRGMDILTNWIADEKILQCAACIGLGQAALDEAISFSKTRRVQKGVQADFQGIRWLLADMYSQLEAARWLTYRTAFLRESAASDWILQAAATKNFVVPAILNTVELSRRIHGSYGYTREFKIERIYRAVAGASVIAVSNEINKSIVAAALVNR
jgi:alkylation response protein AidB-like acyl-CoA dehydrogenase